MLDMKKLKTTDSANTIELPQLSYRYRTIYDQIITSNTIMVDDGTDLDPTPIP